MAEAIELKASPRERLGKGGARTVRRARQVPGTVYGGGEDPQSIVVDYKALWMQHQTGHFQATVVTLDMDGKKVRVLPKEVQVDPVRDFPIHVDFLRITKDSEVTIAVPVHFINDEAAPGLKRGGVLNVARHEIELRCPADRIPEQIEIDLTGLDMGDSIHIGDVTLPEGAKLAIAERDFTIASIAKPSEEELPEDEAEEGEAEGEEDEGGEDKSDD